MATTITGGTAAPKGPPGVPKGKPGAPPRFLNKASGKMETTQQMRGYRAQAGARAIGNVPHAPRAPAIQGSSGTGEGPAKSWLDMGPAELHNYATRQVTQNTQAELQPYRQKAGEIYGTEQAVAQRYGGYGQATDAQLAGLQTAAAGSAKTAENTAADQALKARQAVETTGQNTQAQNGGYLDPQVRTALDNQKALVAASGQTQLGAVQALGANEQNFMANLRAAATQRVQEGQQGIAGTYGKQQAANSQAQNQLLGRVPGGITKLETELGQKQFSNRATEAGLGIKLSGIQQKAAETHERVGATERGQNLAVQRNRENVTQRETSGLRSARLNEIGKETAKMSAEDKARYDQARIRIDEQNKSGKAPNPKEGRSYMAQLSKAEAMARQFLGNQRQGGKPEKRAKEEQARQMLSKEKANGDIISAALNLAVYGRLGPADQATALSYGMTPDMRPQWFRKR